MSRAFFLRERRRNARKEDKPLDFAPTMNDRRLYLVCGLPGAGKTTRARQIVAATGAVHLCVDDWIVALGISLIDFEFRVRLQDCMLTHAVELLRANVGVVIEFGSWHRHEREQILQAATIADARVELHFLDAATDELIRRVRARGGKEAERLVTVLTRDQAKFERPTAGEAATFDRYLGPDDAWSPEKRDIPI
jgi:predicted kinase